MSQEFEERLTDYFKWFRHHQSELHNTESIKPVVQFYGKALDGCLELLAIAAKDIQKLEHRERFIHKPGSGLFLPPGVRR